MSEAKSLVVRKPWPGCPPVAFGSINLHEGCEVLRKAKDGDPFRYEYAHDLSGRFLGVFREVQK